MLGVAVNFGLVILGSLLGLLLKKGVSEGLNKAIMSAIGLCVMFVGIDGMLGYTEPIVIIISMVIGAAIGTLLKLEERLNSLGDEISNKFVKANGNGHFTEGFVTATLLFCIGAMAITGSVSAGLNGDNSILFTKSVIDFVSAIMLTVSLGIGVALAAVPVLLYEGALVLLASLLQSTLSAGATDALVCVGSIIILAIGINLTGMAKFKIANFLPAIILAPFAFYLIELITRG
ncbi:MAG: DUF554 domain-containing protein [Clostridia bacterium]|nr:DUF554 domain-containing protein [Clostridia bacterium]